MENLILCFRKVLSKTVAEAFSFYGNPDMVETEIFVRTYDKFFDCLNVRSRDEYIRTKKPNVAPYTSTNDERLVVSNLAYTT